MRYRIQRHGQLVYEMPHYTTLGDWEARAHYLREHLLAVLGLYPLPERDAPCLQVTRRQECDGYTVENVYFESLPGFYCTGNLFRPLDPQAPCPAVLNLHGHWERGRLEHSALVSVQARCIAFARMGMVALACDMVGYNDSLQVMHHHFASRRGALWGISLMALQTWNAIRAIDLLQSMDEVDSSHIGCTGASGGGTQTFMLAAVDERVGVLAPVNMISAHFQGGCVCENAPGLRTRTHNVEIAALAAPRPMLMVSATGDWTVNTPEVEYPAVREIYRLYDADDRLAWAQVDAPHNYNSESRMHVYRWFARWLLGDEAPAADPERGGDIGACSTESLRVFPSAALPEGAPVGPALERTLGDHARARLQSMPVDACANPSEWHEVIRRRWGHILDVEVPQPADVLSQEHPGGDLPEWSYRDVILGRRGQGDFVRGTLYRPVRRRSERPVLMVHGVGRGGFMMLWPGPMNGCGPFWHWGMTHSSSIHFIPARFLRASPTGHRRIGSISPTMRLWSGIGCRISSRRWPGCVVGPAPMIRHSSGWEAPVYGRFGRRLLIRRRPLWPSIWRVWRSERMIPG
jgi:dienelactone hydrolase